MILLGFTAKPANALTQITVGPYSTQLPDADGFLDGDSDPYLEIRVDGTLIGVTSIVNANNNPTWPSTTFTYTYNPPSSPYCYIEIRAYDSDGLTSDYLGNLIIGYNWLAGTPVTYTGSLNTTYVGSFSITAGISATGGPVPARAKSWGAVKASTAARR